jgi:nitrous oxide reductase accessory protein NosL
LIRALLNAFLTIFGYYQLINFIKAAFMSLSKLLFLVLIVSANLFAYPNYSHSLKVKKIYPMGEKIFKKRCSQVDVAAYSSYDALLSAIQKSTKCGSLKTAYQEALALYLWDHKSVKKRETNYPSLDVDHKEKCPICGMFLYKYPRWVAMIEYKDGKKYYFDGLKDMFKYYFLHPKGIENFFSRDYYTQETIPLKSAYLVLGSNVYGPMGNELIPFKDKKSAEQFLFDHKGRSIIRFKDVTKATVHKLDE